MTQARGLSWKIAAALLVIYVVWGSTYLGIHLAIASIPPLLMAGARWLIAGSALYAYARARGAPRPTLARWRRALVPAILLIVGGNGLVTFASQYVPTGLAAVMLAIVPLWVALFLWAGREKKRPTPATAVGVILGLLGVAFLAGPGALAIGGAPALFGTALLLASALAWALGTLRGSRSARPTFMLLATSLEMLLGGAILTAISFLLGEHVRLDVAAITPSAWLGFAWLILPGSILAYTVYGWLLTAADPQTIVTRNFVNPLVALLLGWLVLGETFTPAMLAAVALVVGGVALHVTSGMRRTAPERASSEPRST